MMRSADVKNVKEKSRIITMIQDGTAPTLDP
jgi:hypothetical protein